MADELLSPPQAADIAGVHDDTVRRAIEFGLLKALKVGRTWAIRRDDLQTWIDAGKPNHRRKSTRKENIEDKQENDGASDS
jgi:excisionase family DNA binding protein